MKEVKCHTRRLIRNTVGRIHEIAMDLPSGSARSSRGIFTNMLSWLTGLATQEQVQAVQQVQLRVVEGVHHTVKMFGKCSKSRVASFAIEQPVWQTFLIFYVTTALPSVICNFL